MSKDNIPRSGQEEHTSKVAVPITFQAWALPRGEVQIDLQHDGGALKFTLTAGQAAGWAAKLLDAAAAARAAAAVPQLPLFWVPQGQR